MKTKNNNGNPDPLKKKKGYPAGTSSSGHFSIFSLPGFFHWELMFSSTSNGVGISWEGGAGLAYPVRRGPHFRGWEKKKNSPRRVWPGDWHTSPGTPGGAPWGFSLSLLSRANLAGGQVICAPGWSASRPPFFEDGLENHPPSRGTTLLAGDR